MLTPFQDRAVRSLARAPFFGELEADGVRSIYRTAVRKGELLFAKDQPSEHLYGLVGGLVKLFSRDSQHHELSLGLVAPGELLGELGIADRAPYHASAVAMAHSELATIQRRDLAPLLRRHPELGASLARASSSAARRLAERLEDAAFLSIDLRIEKALLDLAGRLGERIGQGIRLHLRQQDLADLVGVSRESVNKVLTSRAMRGRLELGRGSIVLIGI